MSRQKATLKMIFLFQWWNMLVPWRVYTHIYIYFIYIYIYISLCMYRYLHTVYPDSRWYGRHCLSHHSHRIQVAAYFRALDMDLNHAWKPLSEQMIGETVKQRRISVSRYFQLQEDGRAIVGQAR